MIASALGLTYLGVVGCYVASPKTDVGTGNLSLSGHSRWGLRLGSLLLLASGLVLSIRSGPAVEGLLLWLAAGMGTCSVIVIAAPLVRGFVPVTSAGAAVTVVCAPLL